MIKTDIIITGGGAAGLMAAAGAGGAGSVLVLEKMPRPGRKIMISGKGRCNLTNMKPWDDFSVHVHPKAAFLKNAFHAFSPEDTVRFFNDNGLETVTERGDRVFPASYWAADVVDTLLKAARKAGAEIRTGAEAVSVTRADGVFTVGLSDGETLTSEKLIITTGGLSYPGTGSTGDGYRWAEEFGHSVTRRFPSLTALVPAGYKILPESTSAKGHIDRSYPLSETGRLLMGNSLKNISLKVIVDGNAVEEEFGDLDFTDGGIEGPVGFKVSRRCVNAIDNGSRVRLVIDLKPAVQTGDLERRIQALWKETETDARSKGRPDKDRFRILLGRLMPRSLADGFLKTSRGAGPGNLAAKLKSWEFPVSGYVGYERCVITAGGVSTAEIFPKTMESRLVPGLYFAGEVLDIDCDTGGYNLQTAFSTGMLAGRSAVR